MVTVLDAAHRRLPSHTFLREAFGFTPAEAALALDLADGLAAADCATLRGVSVHTVRSQLRSLFGKTGTSRQAELVTLILAMGLRQAPSGVAD
jgi:DNA-binding CsgD family transcriptional regulator